MAIYSVLLEPGTSYFLSQPPETEKFNSNLLSYKVKELNILWVQSSDSIYLRVLLLIFWSHQWWARPVVASGCLGTIMLLTTLCVWICKFKGGV